jgi:hypothetical protein
VDEAAQAGKPIVGVVSPGISMERIDTEDGAVPVLEFKNGAPSVDLRGRCPP